MSTVAAIEPRTKIVGANHTDVQISANPWNQPRIVTGGSSGGLFVRDTVNADGWGLINAVAAGQVLASAGVSTVPVWTTSPTLTAITVTTINIPGGGSIGTPGAPVTVGYFTAIQIGPTPASAGALMLTNNQAIRSRNAANTGDVPLIHLDNTNNVVVGWKSGDTSGSFPASAGFMVGPSFNGLGVSGSATTTYTWTVINTGHFVPQTDNTFDIGTASKRVRAIYLAGSFSPASVTASSYVAVGATPALTGALRLEQSGAINARNAANNADVTLLHMDGSNTAWLGNGVNGTIVQGTTIMLSSLGDNTIYCGNTGSTWFRRQDGATMWRIGASDGIFIPGTDNANDIGSAASRVRSGYFGTSVSIGTNPAQSGAIRLANGLGSNSYAIMARNAANTADVMLLKITSSDETFLGSSSYPTTINGSQLIVSISGDLQLKPTGAIYVMPGGTSQWLFTADALWPANDNAVDLGRSTNRVRTGYFATAVAIGTNPASSGWLRLPNSGTINARNAANTADINLIYADSNNAVCINNGSGLTKVIGTLEVGSNFGVCATAGYIRMPNGSNIRARNAANTGDLSIFAVQTDDSITLGSSNSGPIRPSINNTLDFGTTTFMWKTGYFATSINIGTNPATNGIAGVRLANALGVYARNAANTGDLSMVMGWSDNKIYLGDGVTDAGLVLRTTAGVTMPGGLNAWISLGGAAASAGAIRLRNADGLIKARNAADTADCWLLGLYSDDNAYVGEAGNFGLILRGVYNGAGIPAGGVDGSYWISATGTSPSRTIALKIIDGGVIRTIASTTY